MDYFDEFVEAPWGRICVVRRGHVGKPTIFMHGMLDNAGGLQGLANLIQLELQVYIIELPGCGYSDPYPQGLPLHFINFVEVIRKVVEHYQLDDFHFIGHSMGLQIGILYNAIYPGHMQRIVALDSLLYPPVDSDGYPLWYKLTVEAFFHPDTYKKRISPPDNGPVYTYQEALTAITKARLIPDDAAKLILKRALKQVEGTDKYRFTWDQRYRHVITPAFTTQFQLDLYGKFNIPYLVILADKSINQKLQLMNPKITQTFYEKNPQFRLILIEGNHDVHLNKADTIAKYISQFLSNIDPISREETGQNFRNLAETRKRKGKIVIKSKV